MQAGCSCTTDICQRVCVSIGLLDLIHSLDCLVDSYLHGDINTSRNVLASDSFGNHLGMYLGWGHLCHLMLVWFSNNLTGASVWELVSQPYSQFPVTPNPNSSHITVRLQISGRLTRPLLKWCAGHQMHII